MLEKKIYLVGGAVRDRLLGLETYDKDFVAVGYTAQDFSHLKLVGKDFPVFIDENGCELALARIERKISKGYNGFETSTQNVTLEEDLKRRDLTINSMAYDEQKNEVIDPTISTPPRCLTRSSRIRLNWPPMCATTMSEPGNGSWPATASPICLR